MYIGTGVCKAQKYRLEGNGDLIGFPLDVMVGMHMGMGMVIYGNETQR